MRPIGTRVIETKRLFLRPFRSEDAYDMYHNWASHPHNLTYLTWPAHSELSVTEACVERWVNGYHDPKYFKWAITQKNLTESVIGDISVVRYNEKTQAASIGYVLGYKFWGQGYMSEALEAVIHYLIEEVGCYRVEAVHDAQNPASGRVMQKAGMHYEGKLRQAGYNNQGIIDEIYYSILKNELK